MQDIFIFGAALLAVGAAAQTTTTVMVPASSTEVVSVTMSANNASALASLRAQESSEVNAASTSELSPIQIKSLSVAFNALETGLAASLVSDLATEIPTSIYTHYKTVGFSTLAAEYNSSFTQQSWYSAVNNVHTQVQNQLIDIEASILTLTAPNSTRIQTPTTGAATVTEAATNLTTTTTASPSITTSAVASTSASGSPTASSSSILSAGAASQTGAAQAMLGMAAAGAGILGGLAFL